MPVAAALNLKEYCLDTARRAKGAARALAVLSTEQKDAWLRRAAKMLREQTAEIVAANELDLANATSFGLTDAEIDRLRLSAKSVDEIARGLEEVAGLPDPVGEVLETSVRPNGLRIEKVRVP